ncbi:hypothetical protein LN996_01090 [Arthrobacter sp. AK01]|uniref:hypothetical protein n=1 Tax=Arthrobacter sp. AK01 TaxID=2894084 RepID=UPI001E2DC5F1|nr:hypothetical protein [Arthrobacter sp. AK01]MCD4849397.1 hypothetical protein [Arthrobacter sp. AK01]
MAEQKANVRRPTLAALITQEVAWLLGFLAMMLNAADHGPNWIWIGLLTLWQAMIVWQVVKLRRGQRRST